MIRHHRTAVAGLLAAAVFVPACTGSTADPIVTDEATAIQAIVDTLTSSWTVEGQLDLEFTEAHIDALVDAAAGDGQGNLAVQEKEIRLGLDEATRQTVHAGLGADRSFLIGWSRDDRDLAQVRVDGAEVYAAKTLTPDASVLVTLDVPRILQFIDDLDAPAPPADVESLRKGVRANVEPASVRDLLLTLLDGQPGGIAGTLDLSRFGVTEDDLDEMREEYQDELIGLLDAQRAAELFEDAITITDFAHDSDGSTTASVDVHPRESRTAATDLFGAAQGLAEGELGGIDDADLPETLSDVAQLTFDGAGHLVEVRTDVLAIARQLAPLVDDPDPAVAVALERLGGARADVVFTFGRVGELDTVMIEPAATISWDEVGEFFASLFFAEARP